MTAKLHARRSLAGLVLFAALVGLSTAGLWGQTATAPLPGGPSAEVGGRVVLVLPFENRSGKAPLDWIGESFPDTVGQRLSSAGFFTISREDRQFALDHLGLPVDFRPSRATTIRIAQNVDADFVVVGHFTTAGTRIEVQAQVLDIRALRMSAPLADSSELARLFDVENALAWKLARQIDPRFNVAQQTFLAASAGIKLSSFENYIRGTDSGAIAERIRRLQMAVGESPGYSAALLALGKAQYADRQYDGAAATLGRIPPTDRRALEAEFYIGLARFNSAKYADAQTAFTFVASRLPLPEVVNNQGVASSRLGKDATPLFERAVAADPSDADYQYNLAVSRFRRGDFAGAQTAVAAALKIRPGDTEAQELRTHAAAGRGAAAAGAFEPLERLRRTYSEASFRQVAFQLDQMRTLRLASLSPAARAAEYTQLGRDYLSQGLLPEAEQELQSAIAADPKSYAAHALLAEVRLGSASPAEARAEAQASLAIKPNAPAFLILARMELQAGQLTASAADVASALKLEPANTAAQGMRQALQTRGQALP